MNSRHCIHNHRIPNPHSGPPLEFPCPIGSHHRSTEIPQLHLQRLVKRTSAQIESNVSLVILVFFPDLYMSANIITIARLYPYLPSLRRQVWGKARSTTQLCLGSFVFRRRPACERRSSRRFFFSVLFIPTEPARFAELDHSWCRARLDMDSLGEHCASIESIGSLHWRRR